MAREDVAAHAEEPVALTFSARTGLEISQTRMNDQPNRRKRRRADPEAVAAWHRLHSKDKGSTESALPPAEAIVAQDGHSGHPPAQLNCTRAVVTTNETVDESDGW